VRWRLTTAVADPPVALDLLSGSFPTSRPGSFLASVEVLERKTLEQGGTVTFDVGDVRSTEMHLQLVALAVEHNGRVVFKLSLRRDQMERLRAAGGGHVIFM
jgi:hypothetical protein